MSQPVPVEANFWQEPDEAGDLQSKASFITVALDSAGYGGGHIDFEVSGIKFWVTVGALLGAISQSVKDER
jgi:hypothetical protein